MGCLSEPPAWKPHRSGMTSDWLGLRNLGFEYNTLGRVSEAINTFRQSSPGTGLAFHRSRSAGFLGMFKDCCNGHTKTLNEILDMAGTLNDNIAALGFAVTAEKRNRVIDYDLKDILKLVTMPNFVPHYF
jgi:hypothetical protein